MKSDIAIIKVIMAGDPIPAGHSTIRVDNQLFGRLITYTTLAEFRKLHPSTRKTMLEELVNLFSVHVPDQVALLRKQEYFTREDVEGVLQLYQPKGPLNPVNNAFLPPAPAPINPVNNVLPRPLKNLTTNKNVGNKVRNRIPTDVCIHWIEILNKNYSNSPAGRNKNLVLEILKARKLQWMTHDLTNKAMKDSLMKDSDTLRKGGLPRLADIAYNTDTTKDCLYNQLPWNNDYESIKHLLADNMYGAAFDSFWMDALVEGQGSKSLFSTMEKVGQGLSLMLEKDLPSYTRAAFLNIVIAEIRNNPRFWNPQATGLNQVEWARNETDAWTALHAVLNQKIHNGYNVILLSSLTIMMFIGYRNICNQFRIYQTWLEANQANYNDILDEYQKTNGIRKVYNKSTMPSTHVATSGITQIHHPPTNPKSSPLNFRWTLDRKVDLSGGLSRTTLEHGLPYAGGVSGSCNIIAGTLGHLIKDLNVQIDAKEAILGIMMFVVYEGGHSIHEVLWTLYQRELQNKHYLSLGLELTPPGKKPLRGLFVSDYEYFIKMYQSTEAGVALSNARNEAWQKTLEYFNKHSPHKNLFTTTIA